MIPGFISHWHLLWLMIASLLAGVMNAMAGGGSFISFPAMLGVGIPPIEANATNTVALWPGQLTSLATLRTDVPRILLPTVLSISLIGGVIGAELLLHTRPVTFLHLIPWLLLTGSILFGASGPVSRWVRLRAARRAGAHDRPARVNAVLLSAALLPVCVYVGYFGAGSGFLIMTVLALFGMEEMRSLNAMKVLASCVSNFFALVTFAISGRVVWHYCLIAMVFAGLGGYVGALYARRMNAEYLRIFVVVTGLIIAGYFFWKQS